MTFLAIVEQGSINRAATTLNVSQSALTRSLKNFEGRMGGQLLTRGPKGVELTPLGELMADHAKQIQTELHKTEQSLKSFHDTSGKHLSVGVVMVHPLMPFCRSLINMTAANPEMRLRLKFGTAGEMMAALRQGEVEIVLDYVVKGPEAKDFVQDVLAIEEIGLFCSPKHPLAQKRRVTISDLSNAVWTSGPSDIPLARSVSSVFKKAGISGPNVVIEVDMIPLRRALVIDSMLISAFQVHHVRDELLNGRLARLHYSLPQEMKEIGAIRIGRHSQISRRLVQTLRAAYSAGD